jgi:hypothetical protein
LREELKSVGILEKTAFLQCHCVSRFSRQGANDRFGGDSGGFPKLRRICLNFVHKISNAIAIIQFPNKGMIDSRPRKPGEFISE